MSSQVWLRFAKKKKDGTTMKLRIQNLPPERIEEATGLMVKYFLKDEPLRKATGFIKNPEAVNEYKAYLDKTYRDPATRIVMCCADNDDEIPVILGISSIARATAAFSNLDTNKGTEETKKMNALFFEALIAFDLIKEFNLTSYYADRSIVVVPEYRGYGMAEKFLTVRRLMSAAHNVPMTGAWITSYATQIAAERDGWETLSELDYEEMSRKHGLTFEDVPPTIKLMVARPHPGRRGLASFNTPIDKIMSSQVWLRFEKKKKDGTLMKLRIQNVPPHRIGEAAELMAKYYAAEESFSKTLGISKNPKALEEFKEYTEQVYRYPEAHTVMCCIDSDNDNPEIIGISSVTVETAPGDSIKRDRITEEMKLREVVYQHDHELFDPFKSFNCTSCLAGNSLLVKPNFRGYGIAEKFLTVRRLMCVAHDIPLTVAWMSHRATQIAADRDGWKTVQEVDFNYWTQRYGLSMMYLALAK